MTTVLYRWRWAALAALLTAEAMNLLDSTIVQVAAPVMHADLAGPESDIQWFSAAYTLPFAVLLITGGRLGDIAGRKRVFRLGVAGFVLASLCCALAGTAWLLITARAVQGAAAALIIPQTFGLIRSMFEGPELSRALGSIGPVMGLAAICGPALGGILTHADLFGSSWRSVFLVNLPLGLGVLAATRLLREDRAEHRPRLDLLGTGLVVLGAGLVVYPLIQGGDWVLFAAGAAVLAVFAVQQRKGSLVERTLFHSKGFPAALVSSVLFFAVMNGLMLVVVLQLQLDLHAEVLTSGLTMVPWSCGMAVVSWVSGAYLVPRLGNRVMHLGLAVLLLGLLAAIAVYAGTPAGSYPWPLPGALTVCGLGIGLFTTSFFTSALRQVRPQETGSAAGLLNAVQQFGGALGVAVLGSAFLGGTAQTACWVAVAALLVTGLSSALMSG
ncbi:MFS family permease [Kutzneria viridogrisea]|uniref:MFS family permease n=1 Tax=Kutzneria viridogrisea TaxID=47990 RepID=A0ABR6B853_9PSEU|nr:MFS family permease [Kutzneria viridogrisea]